MYNYIWKVWKDKKLKSWVSFSQLKRILDSSFSGFSLSSCPQHSLKELLL
jgi:hypothetical protein